MTADVSEVITGARPPFIGAALPSQPPAGWVDEERVAAGTAVSYREDGEGPRADYRTRILVLRPGTASEFNGTVVVEWLNVSSGLDACPDRTLLTDELHRGGYAWVGVSAQRIGVEGGDTAVSAGEAASALQGKGLKLLDPQRYATLAHPGDAFAYDIFTQVGLAIRAGAVLGDLVPERILAVGSSQSAFALTTYVNRVHAGAFDGYLVHSRGGGSLPLGEPGGSMSVIDGILGTVTPIRDDLDVPVLILQTETDLTILGYARARQDDTDRIRLWEVAGTAHADRYIVGPFAEHLQCGGPVNDGPHHFVSKAALRALDRWVRDDEAPPKADRLAMNDDGVGLRRDEDGIAVGGIRTPLVDVPVDVLSGDPRPGSSIMCTLFGSTDPLADERVVALHGTAAAYLAAFETSADAAVAAGFVLAEDRDSLLAMAKPERLA